MYHRNKGTKYVLPSLIGVLSAFIIVFSPMLISPVAVNANSVGDVNGDGEINILDVISLKLMLLDRATKTDASDVDGNGVLNSLDSDALILLILGSLPHKGGGGGVGGGGTATSVTPTMFEYNIYQGNVTLIISEHTQVISNVQRACGGSVNIMIGGDVGNNTQTFTMDAASFNMTPIFFPDVIPGMGMDFYLTLNLDEDAVGTLYTASGVGDVDVSSVATAGATPQTIATIGDGTMDVAGSELSPVAFNGTADVIAGGVPTGLTIQLAMPGYVTTGESKNQVLDLISDPPSVFNGSTVIFSGIPFAQTGGAYPYVGTNGKLVATVAGLDVPEAFGLDFQAVIELYLCQGANCPDMYTLDIGTSGNGSGSFTPAPGTCNSYLSGTVVTLDATPGDCSTFSGWSGDIDDPSAITTITMDSDKSVTANFDIATFNLTTDVVGMGTVTTDTVGPYDCGTVVTLTATPSCACNFGGWSGDIDDPSAITTITMDSDKSVTATFNQVITCRYVNTSTGSDTGDCSSNGSPCQTINYAVSQANSGDCVRVGPGTYPEMVEVNKSLCFEGANFNKRAGVSPDARSAESIVIGFRSPGDPHPDPSYNFDVTINGFTITPQGDVKALTQPTYDLVSLYGGPMVSVVNNIFDGGAWNISCVDDGCSDMADSALMIQSGNFSVLDNTFTDFRRPVDIPVYETAPSVEKIQNGLFAYNYLTHFSIRGIWLLDRYRGQVTIEGNDFDGTTYDTSWYGVPAIIFESGNNSFVNNSFREMYFGAYRFVANDYGWGPVNAEELPNTFTGNTFDGGAVGIRYYWIGAANVTDVITNNLFLNHSLWGVRSSGAVTPTSNISAGCNWWGNESGPDVYVTDPLTDADSVGTYVNYSPWNTAPGGPCDGTP